MLLPQMRCGNASDSERRKNKTSLYKMVFESFLMFLNHKLNDNLDLTEREINFLMFLTSIIRKSEHMDLDVDTENWFLRSG